MTKLLMSSAVIALVSMASISGADAFSRNGAVTTPRGAYHVGATGGCANGTCSRSVTRTGPYGYSQTHNGAVSCANGACNSQGSTTGPRGYSASHSGTINY